MNPQFNTKTSAKSQSIVDACTALYKTIIHIQPISDLPNILLIQNVGESPPGCSRSSGSSLPRAALRLIPATCNGNRINNKEEIKYNKANFIF